MTSKAEDVPLAEQAPYQPFGAAADLLYCHDQEILMDGPAGTGKSRACWEKCYIAASKYAGARILACRKTRASMTETVLVLFEDRVCPQASPILDGPTRAMRHSYRFPNGSEIIVSGLDKPGKIMSSEFDLIVCFEATEFTEDDFEKLTTRLRNGVMPYQQIIAECNPGAPSHWLIRRAQAGRMARFASRHEDNPTVTPEYLATLDALTGVRRERLRDGIWAAAEGVVYDGFDRRIHVIDRFDVPHSWPRIRAIDFGYTNPFVCQWWALDGDGRMYLYREIYRTKTLVEDHAQAILAAENPNEHIIATVADHDAEDRATLHKRGIQTTRAKKDIERGLKAVMDRLRVQPDGRPRLMLMRDSLLQPDERLLEDKLPVRTEDEFDSYSWPRTVEGRALKEIPDKRYDHGMDAMRYAVMYADARERGTDRDSSRKSRPPSRTEPAYRRVLAEFYGQHR